MVVGYFHHTQSNASHMRFRHTLADYPQGYTANVPPMLSRDFLIHVSHQQSLWREENHYR